MKTIIIVGMTNISNDREPRATNMFTSVFEMLNCSLIKLGLFTESCQPARHL